MLNILITIGLLIAVVIVFAMRRPDTFKVERSGVISASADKIFPHINNLQKWNVWSPWARMDPNAHMTTEGPAEGIGAIHKWDGKKTGKGTMTIIESRPNEFVKMRLDFYKPMKAINYVEFKLEPQGDKTLVIWSMNGDCNLFSKIFTMFRSMDKMVGCQFEDGLKNLQEVVR